MKHPKKSVLRGRRREGEEREGKRGERKEEMGEKRGERVRRGGKEKIYGKIKWGG